jgi:hypothetical protein
MPYDRTKFLKNLEEGKRWENTLLKILKERLPVGVQVIDNRDTYRDNKNRKVPDFTIYNSKTHNKSFYDAKSKKYYITKTDSGEIKELFTMDATFVDSYRSLSKETGNSFYVAFWDNEKDTEAFYVLDVMSPEYDTYYYNNEHNISNSFSYRWDKNNLKRILI